MSDLGPTNDPWGNSTFGDPSGGPAPGLDPCNGYASAEIRFARWCY